MIDAGGGRAAEETMKMKATEAEVESPLRAQYSGVLSSPPPSTLTLRERKERADDLAKYLLITPEEAR